MNRRSFFKRVGLLVGLAVVDKKALVEVLTKPRKLSTSFNSQPINKVSFLNPIDMKMKDAVKDLNMQIWNKGKWGRLQW